MSYTPNFNNPYPNGWKDLPNETTPINASALQAHTDAIEADEQYLQSLDATVDGKVSVQGFAKTWSARTWQKGEILYDGGKTYIANTNTAQRPPHADWTQTNLGDEVSAINMSLANKSDYSTNKNAIGTWIDGKTIYRKVIPFTIPIVETSGTPGTADVAIGSNVSTVVRKDIRFNTNTDTKLDDTWISAYSSAGLGVKAFILNNVLRVRNFNIDYNGAQAYAILEFTETQ